MKEINKLFKNVSDSMFLAIIAGVTLAGSIIFIVLLLWPSFSNWQAGREQVESETKNIDQVKASVSFLQSIDKTKLTGWRNLVDTLLPSSNDILHFVTLQEIIAQAVGVQVTNLNVGQQAPPKVPGTTNTNQLVFSTVSVSYHSTFDSLLKLIEAWGSADRAVEVTDISSSSLSGTDTLTYDVSYSLPVTYLASPTSPVKLSSQEQDVLDKLSRSIIYTATPSAYDYNKTSPFK